MSEDSPSLTPEERRIEREKVRAHYGAFFVEVSAIIFRIDPVWINFESNTDEYDAEAGTILPRLAEAQSVDDVHRIVHEEFLDWFGPIGVRSEERLGQVAEQVWIAWNRYWSGEAGTLRN